MWSLGVLLFELINGVGITPFGSNETPETEVFSRISAFDPANLALTQPASPEALDIVRSLLHRDPLQRLGREGVENIKQHPWFSSVNFTRLYGREIAPPFLDQVTSLSNASKNHPQDSPRPDLAYIQDYPECSDAAVHELFASF